MYENYISPRMRLLDTESAFKTLARAKALEAQGRSIIHMEIGQPDFPTPANVIDAAHRAMLAGHTGYTATPGLPEAREAIAGYVSMQKGVAAAPDEVVIVPGGKPVIFFTMQMLVSPGDEVLYPNPSFPIYESCVKFAGGVPVPVPLKAEDGFRIDVGALKSKLTDRTKLLILNNPANPTGGVYTRRDVLDIAEALKDRPGVFVLSDEIYDRLVYDDAFENAAGAGDDGIKASGGGKNNAGFAGAGRRVTSIASIPWMKDRTIILDGMSKTYSMTGWRLGYGVMHRELAEMMELLAVNSFSCAAAFTQMAAVEALRGPQGAVEEMRAAFRERRDYLVSALNSIDGIKCQSPGGAFYAFPDITGAGVSSAEFADRLLTEGGVAASSGASFGAYGEGFIRLSYATSLENIKIAVERISAFVRTL